MLRLAFDFIITWRETRTRPNAYQFKSDNRIVTHLQFSLAFKRFQLALIISDKTT